MINCHLIKREHKTARHGIATLEFAMALPVLLLLMVGITWLGFSLIGQTEVIVQARDKAWGKRFENKSDAPLHFPILPGYDRDADFVNETAEKKVTISAVFSKFPGPKAGFTVLAGSWDHRAMKFDEPPDLKLMATAAAVGYGGKLLDFMSQLTNPLGAFKQLGGGLASEAANAPNVVGKDDGSDSGSSGTGGTPNVPPGGKTPEESKADTEAKRKKAIEEKMKRYQELGAVLDPRNDRIDVTGGEMKKAETAIKDAAKEDEDKSKAARDEKDDEKKKKLQEESARAHRKVELARIESKRLEAEFLDTVDELDALGIDKWELWFMSGRGF